MPIAIEHLSYIYSPRTPYEKRALDDVTFTIEDGDFFGIVGQTGSGKSTLISHLNALTRVTQGRILVDDMDLSVKKLDFKRLRSTVGMVFQYPEYQLFDETVLADVMFGCKNIGMDDEAAEARAREAMAAVGLPDELAERSPFELSGGQKRRAAIAGVIAMRPKVLVLDEPTAGLDPRGKNERLDLIGEIKAHMCPTIVMISHNMDEIARCCNRIAVMHEGKLLGVFAPAELFGQKETLDRCGLEMPGVTALAGRLADAGFAIDRATLTEETLVRQIEAALPGGRDA